LCYKAVGLYLRGQEKGGRERLAYVPGYYREPRLGKLGGKLKREGEEWWADRSWRLERAIGKKRNKGPNHRLDASC
jgi:hypothetical protein